MGNVLITGDLAHFRENFESNLVPMFNTDRAASLASIDRFKQIARNLEATVIIQHDPRDVCRCASYISCASDTPLTVPRVRAERHRVLRAHQRVDAREYRDRHALSVPLR